jgi:AbrB family looped-hinge helix DNA binding protein
MPQSLSAVHIHLVFSTKGREPFLQNAQVRKEMHAYLGGITKEPNCPPVIVGGTEDHVHLLCRLARTISQADWGKEIKRVSSIRLNHGHVDSPFKNVLLFKSVIQPQKVRRRVMATEAVKITKKGQVTIPKKIRDRLQATEVYFEVVNDEIVVRAVRDAAGSLSEYARNVDPDISIERMKDRAWEEAVHEKTGKKSA